MFIIIFILILILIFLFSEYPRYFWFLPSLPLYPDNQIESMEVLKLTYTRDVKMENIFNLTDITPSKIFLPYVDESIEELDKIITSNKIIFIILFIKLLFNRARPWQVNKKITPLLSIDFIKTNYSSSNTPSYPAGHSFQAYYLAKLLSKKYPSKKDFFIKLAFDVDDSRVRAGIHYPSDGFFSRQLVDYLMKFNII